MEGSAYSSVTGNGLCGQVYCAGYTLTSGRLNSARRLQDSISRVSLDNAVMLQESVFDHSVTVLNVGRVVLVAPISTAPFFFLPVVFQILCFSKIEVPAT